MIKLSKTDNDITYIDSSAKEANQLFSDIFYSYLIKKDPTKKAIILCIGTDRATGDSLGPLIGYKLKNNPFKNAIIYGDLDKPVHAKNLDLVLTEINLKIPDPFIIAIDACLGRINHIGYITIGEGSLSPGAGVNKKLPSVGDISITGIVNTSGLMDVVILQNTRLNLVMKMADTIASGIFESINKYESMPSYEERRIKMM